MKILFSAAVVLFSLVFLSSCKGDAGPAGPEGPAGATGSANVTQYSFAAFTHSGSEISRDFNLTQANLDKSMLYAYVRTSGGFWYPLPGSVTSSFEYRIYYGSPTANNTRFYMGRLSGTGDQSFTALRIVVIPAATLVNGRYSVDFKNYLQVAQTFGLPVH